MNTPPPPWLFIGFNTILGMDVHSVGTLSLDSQSGLRKFLARSEALLYPAVILCYHHICQMISILVSSSQTAHSSLIQSHLVLLIRCFVLLYILMADWTCTASVLRSGGRVGGLLGEMPPSQRRRQSLLRQIPAAGGVSLEHRI